jgi:hypothetical protein
MKHDPLAKTTRIPFKVLNGKLVHFYDGKPITELRDGCTGDIVIEDFKIKDPARVLQYNAGADVDFLPEGTRLLARINPRSVPEHLRKFVIHNKQIGSAVEICLTGKLVLFLRGTKEGTLLPCGCAVPALEKQLEEKPPISINQAYSAIATYFEPDRRSNTGNVFNCVYYLQEPLGVWQPLRDLRDRKQADHERTIAAKPEGT